MAVQSQSSRALAVATVLAVIPAISGCTTYGTSYPTSAEESRRPWVAAGARAEPVRIDIWDIVKGSHQAFGYQYGSSRWLNSRVWGDVVRYRAALDLPRSAEATYVIVAINPTCGLMARERLSGYGSASFSTGPFEGEWSWFCAPASEDAARALPTPAREGEPFCPPDAEYQLVLRDGHVFAIERDD